MTPNRIALVLALVTLAGIAWRGRRAARDWHWDDWLGSVVLVGAVVTFWRLAVTAVVGTLTQDWNAARLAPTFSLFYGYDLYYPPDRGPILNNVYGPVAALAFLPAAIFRTPTPAVLAGGVLQDTFVFGALLLFVWRSARGTGDKAEGARHGAQSPVLSPPSSTLVAACGLAACLLMSRYWGPSYWISMVHADGPSLALGLTACALLATRDGVAPSRHALFASALAVVLSLWAKQTAAPLPLALALAVWIGHGRAVALRYVALLAVIGALISACFLVWFGWPMIFNMFVLVSRHGWFRPGATGLAIVVGEFLLDVGELLALCLVLLAVVVRSTRAAHAPLGARPWVAPLLAVVCLLPTGALGANKVGGELSSFHSAYYLIAATTALLVDLVRRRPALHVLAWAFCLLAIAAAWQSGRCTPRASRFTLWQNNQQVAYEFALRHPGEVYFPWAPLASLLAERRLYHFEYGMLDRYIGYHEPTREHLLAFVPSRMRWIAARARIWTFNHFFPDYTVETKIPELPGWIVRSRPAQDETP